MAPNGERRSSWRVKCFSISFCIADDIATPGRSKRRICTASGSVVDAPTWNARS